MSKRKYRQGTRRKLRRLLNAAGDFFKRVSDGATTRRGYGSGAQRSELRQPGTSTTEYQE